jgi:lipopolysaccharide/colanic/teichoic acid biosynthesis glycosyltransferase
MRRPYDPVKRALDAVAASIALLLTLPVQAAVAVAVLVFLGRPVLFGQQRPGRGERVFTLLKFRTMRESPPGAELDDALRLTGFGRRLRATSLDELPSLVNILRGDMSFVGPRPLLVRYLERYSPQQRRRHEVRPGLTGLAQVSGRNLLSWDDRFRLDVDYVDRRSFALDAWVLARTVGIVLRRDGISARDSATMDEFLGPGRSGDA